LPIKHEASIMKITFVNHTSFIIEHKQIRLIVDPWFEGTVFNHGWHLLSPSKFNIEDFKEITHIWFSHEHPDHFYPPILNKIPTEIKKNIVVLFQETNDKKVVDFCKKTGFGQVVELPSGKPYYLDEEFHVINEPFTEGDSWAYFSNGIKSLLNLNDCIVKNSVDAQKIKDKIGKVDVLFTQFSYAHKVGNSEDVELRIQAIQEKKDRIKTQIDTFEPSFVVPFASFVFFCHEENNYMNLRTFHLRDIHDYIERKLNVTSVVLYPGHEWAISDNHPSEEAIEKYEIDFNKINEFELIKTLSVDEKKLISLGEQYAKKLLQKNPTLKYLFKKLPVRIFVSDLDQGYCLKMNNGFFRSHFKGQDADFIITSESLAYMFQYDWGVGTCQVNARYLTTTGGDPYRFNLLLSIGNMNNEGKTYVYKKPNLLKRLIQKIQ
jgi:UDP-MurNAc hydroxylase